MARDPDREDDVTDWTEVQVGRRIKNRLLNGSYRRIELVRRKVAGHARKRTITRCWKAG